MYPHQVHDYLRTFFNETNCTILDEYHHYLTVQLTVDIDKRIMNRPFYWRYIESTGNEPNPKTITFITDYTKLQGKMAGEIINFGTPRLHQLFEATKELGAFVEMYESVDALGKQTILTPWLAVNYKVSYCSHQTKEMLFSFGLNLMTGHLVQDFLESIREKNFVAAIPRHAFPLPYIIKPSRGLERLDTAIGKIIDEEDHSWAKEAEVRWQEDLKVLEFFYEEIEEKPDCYEMEKRALEEQYKPKIIIDIVNGGLFYLK